MSVSKFGSCPAWSMGSGRRSGSQLSLNPGPGAYNPTFSTKLQKPSWRLGTGQRGTDFKKDTPGPGSYEVNIRFKEGPKYHFGGKNYNQFSDTTPGPGAYNTDISNIVATELRPPSFTMRPKTAEGNSRYRVPGPGAYDQTSRIQNHSIYGVKIGTAAREDLYTGDKFTPGPGAYNSRPNSATVGPKYGFGTAKKGLLGENAKANPGPGAYNLKSEFEYTGGGTTLLPKRPTSGSLGGPGPGAYNPKEYGKQTLPSWRIGTASRDGFSSKSQAPGPGTYDPTPTTTKTKSPTYVIGTSVRRPLSQTGDGPGPGAYESRDVGHQPPKFTMVSRKEDFIKAKLDKSTPGPGAYNPSVDYANIRPATVGIGTEERQGFYKTQQGPGPGYYNIRGGPDGPRWGFGSEQRSDRMKSGGAPGPGTYEIPSSIADVPKYLYGGAPLKISP